MDFVVVSAAEQYEVAASLLVLPSTMTSDERSEDLTGREYLRVSFDRSGRARSVGEQHDENVGDAAREGITLLDGEGAQYRDNHRSASRYARKSRDDFERLLSDLRSGEFGADVLYLWESSRGSRKVGEWVDLIELCEKRSVRIRVTTHGRTYDPANPRDRRSLLEDAVDSEYESGKVSARARRASAASAAAGRPHGRAPYGYRRVYDERSGALVGQEADPVEAPVVAELFSRLAGGHSLRSIANDFAARGVEKRSGGPFSAQHLRSMALLPTYAAMRVHIPGGRRERMNQSKISRSLFANEVTQIVEASWPAVVGRDEFLAVRERLTDPVRIQTRPGRGVHLLSMIARCADCGAVLVAAFRDPKSGGASGGARRRVYQCRRNGCVRIGADELDAFAVRLMVDYLSAPEVLAEIASTAEGEGEHAGMLAAVRAEIAEATEQGAELGDALASGAISVALAARSEPQIRARLADAERRERELSTPSALHFLIGQGSDIAAALDEQPMPSRRQIVKLLFAPELLGDLFVHKRPEGRRGGRAIVAAHERVELRR